MRTGRSEVSTPPGWHNVIPRLVAHDSRGLVQFVRDVLGASGEFEEERPTVLTIGDSRIMVSEVGVREGRPGFLYVYLSDPDAAYERAMARGARTIEPPGDTPYGDRRCTIEDPWGNTWQLAAYRAP